MEFLKYRIAATPTVANLTASSMVPQKPTGNQILVRIEANSLNFHDYLIVSGMIPAARGRVPLADGVGIVEDCGPDADRFKTGDRVMGTFFPNWTRGRPHAEGISQMRGDHVDGFAASHVTLPDTHFTRAPANLSPGAAACLPCAGLAAWRALFVEGTLNPGDTVLVQGTGGLSLFALQFARAAGAVVIATTGSPDKVDRLRDLGAHAVFDRLDPEWGSKVRELTGGGVDLVVEVSGGDVTQSLHALRTGGRLCVVGVMSFRTLEVSPQALLHGNLRMSGITAGSREHQEAMIAAVEKTRLTPMIASTFPLTCLREAFGYFADPARFGKVVISSE